MRTLFASFESKLDLAIDRYKAARTALLALDPTGSWQNRYREFTQADNRGPGRDPADSVGVPTNRHTHRGEGFHQPSWIWLTGTETVDPSAETLLATLIYLPCL